MRRSSRLRAAVPGFFVSGGNDSFTLLRENILEMQAWRLAARLVRRARPNADKSGLHHRRTDWA